MQVLDDLFTRFDSIADRRGLEKIKTIGDAYMAVAAGCPSPRADHAVAGGAHGLDMSMRMEVQREQPRHKLRLRIGITAGRSWPASSASASSSTTCGGTR